MSILVYLLEDDLDIARLIERSLAQQGFSVRPFRRLADFERALRSKLPDLCLIDLSLPDGDGLGLLSSGVLPRSVPRVVVTGRGSVTDRVVGLEIGADDYIVKPFETRELVARLRAVLRRSRMAREDEDTAPKALARFGEWRANITACTLTHERGETVSLSSSENALLEAFLRAPGRVLTRANLLDATTGRGNEPFDRSMDARICRLRRKLGDNPRSPDIIRTVYGAGYIFAKDVDWQD
ncbi:MAG: response regulator transcription factor [Paracoccaceae bacterium]|jgi:DNA-binding response OmpR family regulator